MFLFDGALRVAIHRLKYRQGRGLAGPLGTFMADYWKAHRLPADVIVPVPLHPTRLQQRGYNQATLLARELGQQAALPVDDTTLQRVRDTASQMQLDAAERLHNVRGAFRCQDGQVRNQGILLVDDVCTTGATLESCADALREGGGSSDLGSNTGTGALRSLPDS